MYLEAVAMLPQIYMFQRQASDQGGIVEVRDRDGDGERVGDRGGQSSRRKGVN